MGVLLWGKGIISSIQCSAFAEGQDNEGIFGDPNLQIPAQNAYRAYLNPKSM